MSSVRIGPLKQAWFKWKALRLPWRKRFLVGIDLQGNTYWEFRLTTRGEIASHSERWRRIVHYPRSTHLSSVKVSPLWHQWLRYTRDEPPSLTEQREDVARQVKMKYLAAEADARWDAKPRVMDAPMEETQQALPKSTPEAHKAAQQDTQKRKDDEKDPWARARAQGPGESWQPAAWDPKAKK